MPDFDENKCTARNMDLTEKDISCGRKACTLRRCCVKRLNCASFARKCEQNGEELVLKPGAKNIVCDKPFRHRNSKLPRTAPNGVETIKNTMKPLKSNKITQNNIKSLQKAIKYTKTHDNCDSFCFLCMFWLIINLLLA